MVRSFPWALGVRPVVEVDGGYHASRARADPRRDGARARLGWRVVRVSAEMAVLDGEQAIGILAWAPKNRAQGRHQDNGHVQQIVRAHVTPQPSRADCQPLRSHGLFTLVPTLFAFEQQRIPSLSSCVQVRQ
ncbi:MAG: DUF559 domain-containing protein [Myxococcales bacterium]|nr:DUF559 domain-containing protein [Myxococcales bacterium]